MNWLINGLGFHMDQVPDTVYKDSAAVSLRERGVGEEVFDFFLMPQLFAGYLYQQLLQLSVRMQRGK